MLIERLRPLLLAHARAARVTTYTELADRLGLEPPHTIHRVTEALEALMAEDVAAGRPLLAALCVSRLQHGLPARGFFITARDLGVFAGSPEGEDAQRFHAHELERAFAFYRPSGAAPS